MMDNVEQGIIAMTAMDTTTSQSHLHGPVNIESSKTTVVSLLRWLTLADYTVACFIITPLVVSYWRATWKIIDVLTISYDPVKSGWICTALGCITAASCYLLQHFCSKNEQRDIKLNLKHILPYFGSRIVEHLYIIIFGISIIIQWWGVWKLWDSLMGICINSGLTSMMVGWGCLILLRSLINALNAPLVISSDSSKSLYRSSTRFGITLNSKHDNLENYCLDVIFTSAVVYNLVASLWRGVWTLLNQLIYPGDFKMSAAVSAGIGVALITLAFALQYSAQSSSEAMDKRYPFFLRVILQDILVSIGLVGVINVWRSVWMALDVWQTTTPTLLACSLTHIFCYLALVFLHTATTVHFRGCMHDGKSAIFPVFYTRYFLKNRFYKEDIEREGNTKTPTGKDYPSCSCNHYCLLLNVPRGRNAEDAGLVVI